MLSNHINVQIPLMVQSPNFKTFQVIHKIFLNVKASWPSNNHGIITASLQLDGTSGPKAPAQARVSHGVSSGCSGLFLIWAWNPSRMEMVQFLRVVWHASLFLKCYIQSLETLPVVEKSTVLDLVIRWLLREVLLCTGLGSKRRLQAHVNFHCYSSPREDMSRVWELQISELLLSLFYYSSAQIFYFKVNFKYFFSLILMIQKNRKASQIAY